MTEGAWQGLFVGMLGVAVVLLWLLNVEQREKQYWIDQAAYWWNRWRVRR